METTAQSDATTRAIVRKRPAGRKRGRKKAPGQKSTYTKAKGRKLLDLMFNERLSVNQACQRPGTPSRRTVYRWFKRYRSFWKAYISMCEFREGLLTENLMARTDPSSRKDRSQFNKAMHKVQNLRPKRIEVQRGPWGQRMTVGYGTA